MAAAPPNEGECPICLGTLDRACQAPCGHIYCRECIISVMEMRPPNWSGSCPLCRRHISVYNLRDEANSVLLQPEVTSLYGNAFVQAGGLGMASYHFDSPEECYISYANAPASWKLADGTPPPAKKPWVDYSFDSATLTFRGKILWDPAFNGMRQWDYEIVFAEDFIGVVGGQVKMVTEAGETSEYRFNAPWEHSFDRGLAYLLWSPPPASIFGQAYVQGQMYHPYLEGIASYHFETPDTCYISYDNAPPDWTLDDGNAPPAQKAFIDPTYDSESRTFRGTIEWEVSFGGDAKWEYEMVFADDFSSIIGGQIRSWGPTGREKATTRFGRPRGLLGGLLGGLGGQPMVYVLRPTALSAALRMRNRLEEATQSAAPGASEVVA